MGAENAQITLILTRGDSTYTSAHASIINLPSNSATQIQFDPDGPLYGDFNFGADPHFTTMVDGSVFPTEFVTCVYRQLKRGRSGDEVRPEWRVN